MRRLILKAYDSIYQQLNKRIIFKKSAQDVHHQVIEIIRFFEKYRIAIYFAKLIHRITFTSKPTIVGGVSLPHPFILAAGFVKGDGFENETIASNAILAKKQNIIPGWRIMPALVGLVEFGSYTRYPRLGNRGTVIWRDVESKSTQNRIGLKNPGAMVAAKFLGKQKHYLPKTFGINIAVSPGVTNINQQQQEVIESLDFFLNEQVIPTWFTLNLSCPNTEDDPHGNQLEAETKQLCSAFIQHLQDNKLEIPLWVKISPDLALEQYQMLAQIFDEVGVKVIIATNTLAQPTPDDKTIQAGVGGGDLFKYAVFAVHQLQQEKTQHNYAFDIIGCGGVIDGSSYHNYLKSGATAIQYWSALVYRGPLAAALIESELSQYESGTEAIYSKSITQH